MNKKQMFQRQHVLREFAFGCVLAGTVAACTTTGTSAALTQSQIQNACDITNSALLVAEAFSDKLTPTQNTVLDGVGDIVADQCSPAAIAADTTPEAIQSVLSELAAGLVQAQQVHVTQ